MSFCVFRGCLPLNYSVENAGRVWALPSLAAKLPLKSSRLISSEGHRRFRRFRVKFLIPEKRQIIMLTGRSLRAFAQSRGGGATQCSARPSP